MQSISLKTPAGQKHWQQLLRRRTGLADPLLVRRDVLTKKVFGKPVCAREAVTLMLEQVRKKGDEAIKRYEVLLDGVAPRRFTLIVSDQERERAEKQVPPALKQALKEAAVHIRQFHEAQLNVKYATINRPGVKLSERRMPLDCVGIYVPGGNAPLVSTVLMNALPAKVAGVKEIYMATPPDREGQLLPAIVVAANLAGVTTIFRMGGAPAIAALAYGTASVPKVNKIVGPANIFGTEAKRQVVGQVGIDGLAGPSEIVIIADSTAKPEQLAWDLLAQGEHGSGSVAVLISTSDRLVKNTQAAAQNLVKANPILNGAYQACTTVVVKSLEEAAALADAYGPEHLSLQLKAPRQILNKIRKAGAIFLGSSTAQAMGDYTAGPNHVLPTGGTTAWASPLSVRDFERYTSIVEYTPQGMAQEGPGAVAIATTEGLIAHAQSIKQRLKP